MPSALREPSLHVTIAPLVAQGVTIPSQIRYVDYFGQVVKSGGVPEPAVVVLTKIRMYTVPNFDPTGGCGARCVAVPSTVAAFLTADPCPDPYFVVLKSTGGSFKQCQKLYNMKVNCEACVAFDRD